MITNEREYRTARAELRRFEADLHASEAVVEPPDVDPMFAGAIPNVLSDQLEELRNEIRLYEDLRVGKHRIWQIDDLAQLPDVLIAARIARGLNQRELADTL